MFSLEKLSQNLGYTFKNPQWLKKALTHRSLKTDHNERLEFLGDAVLGLVITAALFHRHPTVTEGTLSAMRANLVCEQTLVSLAKQFRLASYIRVGASERKEKSKKRPALLADTLEAIIGAIYLDSTWSTCEACILEWYQERLEQAEYITSVKDAKTAVQEYLQAHAKPLPRYQLITQTGSSHAPTFTIECQLPDASGEVRVARRGIGKSRREAEQQAASKILTFLQKDVDIL